MRGDIYAEIFCLEESIAIQLKTEDFKLDGYIAIPLSTVLF